ncbi:hypothetical protein QTO34_001747 [Cnephaeus nilssonii]|uniref:CCHC-type domain-containing protein n=1 Tax=Cnephaeus nilssonii TaxID=3371016 RepID=A0AA40LL81_CNENI|nr:hypothetical protein QTO34_001747 [Eptesicus nilssonii]
MELRQGEGGVRHLPGPSSWGRAGLQLVQGLPDPLERQLHAGPVLQCGEEGHRSPYGRKGIVCNLCGKRGHAFAQCPKAVPNAVALSRRCWALSTRLPACLPARVNTEPVYPS